MRYRVTATNGDVFEIDNPQKFPDPSEIKEIDEPIIDASVITREEYVGEILKLLEEKRGTQKSSNTSAQGRVMLLYESPLNEIVLDFYDRLKSASRGYASLDYHLSDCRELPPWSNWTCWSQASRWMLSMIVHKEFAYKARQNTDREAAQVNPAADVRSGAAGTIGKQIITRAETIAALRKNVLAKCYGGDISRKRKLLEKQKEGKRRMKRVGRVEIPQEAFLAVLKVSTGSDSE